MKFINEAINDIVMADPILSKKEKSEIVVFDIFSGSGIVSRSLKQFGYTTYANDLEVYTKALNQTFIETNEEDLPVIFNGIYKKLLSFYHTNKIAHEKIVETTDEYCNIINLMNSVRDLGNQQQKPYFSKYYSAKDTKNPNFKTERLFYTQENGKFIDTVLETVFEFKDSNNNNIFNERARNIILSSLFNKMTTNVNTSGTMKGFHDGWGGKGKNALERILADMKLERIELLKKHPKGKGFNDYAENIFINNPDLSVDVIYADPPYNQHQYSANYHMLTTAMNNRDYVISETLTNGERAGIRKDHNRSDFSKGKKSTHKGFQDKVSDAYVAFDKFIKNTMGKTKYIIISYNQEGVLSHEELIDVLSQNGSNSISIKIQKHDKFKGGKNTNLSNSVVEYLFIVKTNAAQATEEINNLKAKISLETKTTLLLDKYINLSKAKTKDGISIENLGDNTKISFLKSNVEIMIDNTYKVISHNFNVNVNSQENMSEIEMVIYQDFEKEELINDYIKEQNYSAAIKVLSSLKIKKHKEKFVAFINKLQSLDLNKSQQLELNKLKSHLK